MSEKGQEIISRLAPQSPVNTTLQDDREVRQPRVQFLGVQYGRSWVFVPIVMLEKSRNCDAFEPLN